ncbi:calcineurin-like phosphoesterase family protein [Antricoccus suffuscus]|uniref:Calcineurin-like phosphoesterase family protein n=1 Tax=Antricoccus suffuscus TaxID=1629062 RepID=A0A2T1A739_9ACTN|nr:metallophosphoesterase [Antricoccus suffuscus]PRZ44423.1 calcineurin-like phosphoesterase family protein [Antricoccus suffuscus]
MSTELRTIVHLSDTHIRGDGTLARDSIDTLAHLRAVADRLVAADRPISAIILSGDLSDDGSEDAYRLLHETLAPAASALDARLIYAMGNHDQRAGFATLPGILDDSISNESPDEGSPFDRAYDVDGLRIIVLDSTRPGLHDGHLEPHQLAWLADQLGATSPRGTLVVMHHPPISSPLAPVHQLRLKGSEELADVLSDSDVRMVLCGHTHYTGMGTIAGIPVWIGPAMAYRLDAFAPAGQHRGQVGYGFSRIDLVGDDIVATAVEATIADEVYRTSEAAMLDLLRDHTIAAG